MAIASRLGAITAPAGLLLLLAGCSDVPNSIDPVSWWHNMEGGAIAQDRPPPPNPKAPFPHLAAAPKRPAGMPDAEWADLKAALTAQGANAHQYAADNPIPTLPTTPANGAAQTPKPAPVPAKPPAAAVTAAQAPTDSAADMAAIQRLENAQGPNGSNAGLASAKTVAAATAATQAPASASASNGTSVTFGGPDQPQNAQKAPPPGPQSLPVNAAGQPEQGKSVGTHYTYFDPNNGLSVPGALGPVAQPDEAHPPALPTSIPAPAAVPGFAIPALPSTYVPPKVLPQPAPYVAPAPLPPVPPLALSFPPRSAVLSAPMKRALLQLVYSRQTARIAVTGYGDAASETLADQSAAMPLALERSRAITVQLMADGLPADALVPSAQALGQGGLARLVD
ncbi:hypothetical protein ACELLULO517_15085 [Acidisoma cellulosilytica]|uniref:OmpA-like domain-containing protein n=1 Tax=Acidisoma cellulosilyticum TaxID=2802395 RepID=A0A963Z2B9_9PROT|nr:hypothetical protein [Acidisoma cellulosilyticum]MCB8881572.1 hypothetical protein [Acidisoma cellulosilyticum]